jgi:hypothetical protein
MDDSLTLAEIEARYGSEWILLAEPELDRNSQLVGGRVLYHSKSRDEVDQKDLELRPTRAAIIYTGIIADDAAVVL